MVARDERGLEPRLEQSEQVKTERARVFVIRLRGDVREAAGVHSGPDGETPHRMPAARQLDQRGETSS